MIELAPWSRCIASRIPDLQNHVDKPSDVLSIGQEITAKVVDLNEAEKKISLSMKALESDSQGYADEETEA